MSQSSSQLTTQQTSPQMANFYHICNIIPDVPEHHHRIWSPLTEQLNNHVNKHKPTPTTTAAFHKTTTRNNIIIKPTTTIKSAVYLNAPVTKAPTTTPPTPPITPPTTSQTPTGHVFGVFDASTDVTDKPHHNERHPRPLMMHTRTSHPCQTI